MEITTDSLPKTPFLYAKQKLFLFTLSLILLLTTISIVGAWILSLNHTLIMSVHGTQVHLKTGFEYALPRILISTIIIVFISWSTFLFFCLFFFKRQLFPHPMILSVLNPKTPPAEKEEILSSLNKFPDVHAEISSYLEHQNNKNDLINGDIQSLLHITAQFENYMAQVMPHLSKEDTHILCHTLSDLNNHVVLLKQHSAPHIDLSKETTDRSHTE